MTTLELEIPDIAIQIPEVKKSYHTYFSCIHCGDVQRKDILQRHIASCNITKGYIYMIYSPSNPTKRYIGSTLYLPEKRFINHKASFSSWSRQIHGASYCSSFDVLKLGDAVLCQLEIVQIQSRAELRKKEYEWIQRFPDAVNRVYGWSITL